MSTEYSAEAEELMEATISTRLASVCTIPVQGFITPTPIGEEKRLSSDTFVGVRVDQSSQDGDYVYRAPFTYSVQVTVHFAQTDDATGTDFRDECRIVRANLSELVGDGCSSLTSSAFSCDQFMLDSTSSNFEGGDNPVFTKTYTATVKGRQTITTEANNG